MKRSGRPKCAEVPHWMSQTPAFPDAAQVSEEVTDKPLDLVGVERETGSGGV